MTTNVKTVLICELRICDEPQRTTAGRSGCPASANRYVYVEDSFSNSCRNNRECCWPFLTFLPLLLLLTPAIMLPDWRALDGKNELRATSWGFIARVTLPSPNACIWENPSRAQSRLQIRSHQHCEVLQSRLRGIQGCLTRKIGDHGRILWTSLAWGDQCACLIFLNSFKNLKHLSSGIQPLDFRQCEAFVQSPVLTKQYVSLTWSLFLTFIAWPLFHVVNHIYTIYDIYCHQSNCLAQYHLWTAV